MKASTKNYNGPFVHEHGRRRFSVYTKFEDDPDYFQCQVSEIHPYDLAEYAWAEKDSPCGATVYKAGKKIGIINLPEYDPDNYEECYEYLDDIIDRIAVKLIWYNKGVEPRIDHT